MTDREIENAAKKQNIIKIAKKIGLKDKDLILYSENIAKINKIPGKSKAKLILVTSINPTKAGEGKTTVSIGLADAFSKLKKKVCLALREPSLGPVFGIKGGATGGGLAQIIPSEEINLHFTGDFHAITSANNLLCSMIDNHIFQGNELKIDVNKIYFHRCVDLNDRALRDITLNCGRYSRREEFSITAASEIMAILCLAENIEDLRQRLGNILIGLNIDGKPVYAHDLKAQNAMTALLKNAIKPNLVQTIEGTPAIVHCGPFANIAHGCNSIIATKTACSLADYVITEAGFGADLGAEKFLDFKCRQANLKPDCVVLVITIKALKLHGGVTYEKINEENVEAVEKGIQNAIKHYENITQVFGLPCIVTLNKFTADTQAEIDKVTSIFGDKLVVNNVWGEGGSGGIDLAQRIISSIKNDKNNFKFAYNLNDSLEEKIDKIVKKIYGGKSVKYSPTALEKLRVIKEMNLDDLPVIMAKTQYSFSSDDKLLGRPSDFEFEIKDFELRTGAGFIVAICGKMLLMPGLPRVPSATLF